MDAQLSPTSKGGFIAALATRLDRGLAAVSAILAVIGVCALVVAIAVVIGDIVWRRMGGGSVKPDRFDHYRVFVLAFNGARSRNLDLR